MKKPKVVLPQEDPADKAARQAEQARAETARIQETQGLLAGDTLRRLRRFGRNVAGAAGPAAQLGSLPGGVGGVASGGGSVGDFMSDGGGFSFSDIRVSPA